jgi:hypothetical protein
MEKAVELGPDNGEVLFTRAELMKRTGESCGDRRIPLQLQYGHITGFLKLNPNNTDAWSGREVCWKEQGKEELSRLYQERAQDIFRWG